MELTVVIMDSSFPLMLNKTMAAMAAADNTPFNIPSSSVSIGNDSTPSIATTTTAAAGEEEEFSDDGFDSQDL